MVTSAPLLRWSASRPGVAITMWGRLANARPCTSMSGEARVPPHRRAMPTSVGNLFSSPTASARCPRLPEAARGCPRLPEAARGCTRLPEAARGCPRLHEAARGCTRLHEASRTQSSHDDLVLQVDAFAQDSELLGDLEGQFAGRARGEERKGPGRGRARERVRDAWATGAPRGHGRRTDRVGVSTKANTP